MKHGVDNAFLDAGKEGEHYDIGVEKVVRLHGARRVGASDEVLVIADMDACLCQWGIVEGAESVEILGIDLVVRLPASARSRRRCTLRGR